MIAPAPSELLRRPAGLVLFRGDRESCGTESRPGHSDGVSFHGFTLINGTFTTVDYPGATNSHLTGLNNTGQIVGAYDNGQTDPYGNPLTHGFLLDSGTFTAFDSPYAGVAAIVPWGINDKGMIVGQSIDANDFFLGFQAKIGK